jgi:hypothetical protein
VIQQKAVLEVAAVVQLLRLTALVVQAAMAVHKVAAAEAEVLVTVLV